MKGWIAHGSTCSVGFSVQSSLSTTGKQALACILRETGVSCFRNEQTSDFLVDHRQLIYDAIQLASSKKRYLLVQLWLKTIVYGNKSCSSKWKTTLLKTFLAFNWCQFYCCFFCVHNPSSQWWAPEIPIEGLELGTCVSWVWKWLEAIVGTYQ